jgi:hypothetical protein
MKRIEQQDRSSRITIEVIDVFYMLVNTDDRYQRQSLHDVLMDKLDLPPWKFPCIRWPYEVCTDPPGSDQAREFAEARALYDELSLALDRQLERR